MSTLPNDSTTRNPARPTDAEALAALRTVAAWLGVAPVATSAERLTLPEAARRACTSVRVLREAIRHGDLPAAGGQRDRSVTAADIEAWIASRAVAPHAGPDDHDIESRMKRLRIVGGGR